MHWIVLLASAVLEAIWATALGQSQGFTAPVPTAVFAVGLILSMLGLGYASKRIPMSTAYAVWTGTGAALTVTWSMLTGDESPTVLRVLFLAGIVACVIGLKLVPASPHTATVISLTPAEVRSKVTVPLQFADGFTATATAFTFNGLMDGKEHLLLAFGRWERSLSNSNSSEAPPLVRLHSECMTGDVFGSQRCDCGPQLREAVEKIALEGGFLLYLRQEGRGIGLYSKIEAYALQDKGLDTFEANIALGHKEDEREYSTAVDILRAVGVHEVRLLTNNPDKAKQLHNLGIEVTEQIPTDVHLTANNHRYLMAKRDHGAHILNLPPAL
jgi:GTP cyclohydrolase II